jgi:hypothetical protein
MGALAVGRGVSVAKIGVAEIEGVRAGAIAGAVTGSTLANGVGVVVLGSVGSGEVPVVAAEGVAVTGPGAQAAAIVRTMISGPSAMCRWCILPLLERRAAHLS